jgi:hypothetical protein
MTLLEVVSICADQVHKTVTAFLQINFLDSNLEVIEFYFLPATFSGLLIFFICRASSGYEMLFLMFLMSKS